MKLVAFSCLYWNDLWNTMDFVIIGLSVVELIITQLGLSGDSSGVNAKSRSTFLHATSNP